MVNPNELVTVNFLCILENEIQNRKVVLGKRIFYRNKKKKHVAEAMKSP